MANSSIIIPTMKNPSLSCSLPGSSWCISSTRTRLSTQGRRPTCGTCTSSGVGTSSQLVTASGNSMKKNYQVEGRLAEQPFLHHLRSSISKWRGHRFFGTDHSWCSIVANWQPHAMPGSQQHTGAATEPLFSWGFTPFIAIDRSRTLVYKKISTYIYVYIYLFK